MDAESTDALSDAPPVAPPGSEDSPVGRGEPLVIAEAPPTAGAELDRFWMAVRRLPKYLKLTASLARDGDVPRRAKAILAIGGAYSISPVDLVPGVIPVAGQLDDLLVLLYALRTTIRACPTAVAAAHLERAGLEPTHLDDDLTATKDAARWLAAKGVRTSRAIVSRSGRQIGRLWRGRFEAGG